MLTLCSNGGRSIFRRKIAQALPEEVRDGLNKVVCLAQMPFDQYADNIVHHVNSFRKKVADQLEEDIEVKRQLAKAQLRVLTQKLAAESAVKPFPIPTAAVEPATLPQNRSSNGFPAWPYGPFDFPTAAFSRDFLPQQPRLMKRGYSGCHQCGSLRHMRRNCDGVGARIFPQCQQGPSPFRRSGP